ncbi:hypothetical protein VdG1_01618 [Verticillium dahliae VDG1]|nr:hypothetical protein VdG1_01618 [Verticillium dahliae VDG1]
MSPSATSDAVAAAKPNNGTVDIANLGHVETPKVQGPWTMVEYERRGEGRVDLGEFAYVATKFALPETSEWADAVLKEREDFWGSVDHVHGEAGVEGGVGEDRAQQQDHYYEKK